MEPIAGVLGAALVSYIVPVLPYALAFAAVSPAPSSLLPPLQCIVAGGHGVRGGGRHHPRGPVRGQRAGRQLGGRHRLHRHDELGRGPGLADIASWYSWQEQLAGSTARS